MWAKWIQVMLKMEKEYWLIPIILCTLVILLWIVNMAKALKLKKHNKDLKEHLCKENELDMDSYFTLMEIPTKGISKREKDMEEENKFIMKVARYLLEILYMTKRMERELCIISILMHCMKVSTEKISSWHSDCNSNRIHAELHLSFIL